MCSLYNEVLTNHKACTSKMVVLTEVDINLLLDTELA